MHGASQPSILNTTLCEGLIYINAMMCIDSLQAKETNNYLAATNLIALHFLQVRIKTEMTFSKFNINSLTSNYIDIFMWKL